MYMSRAVLVVGAVLGCSAVAAAQQPTPSAIVTKRAMPQGFSVVLVLGDQQGGTTADNVPPAARKALADLKDFLPYKSYHLLDSGWIMGSNRVWQRLRGPDNQEYELSLTAATVPNPEMKALRIEFTLREADGTAAVAIAGARPDAEVIRVRIVELSQLRERLEREARAVQEKSGDKSPAAAGARAQMDSLSRQIAELDGQNGAVLRRAGAQIINTSFNMDMGETVVVGTSRVRGGDKALIALLTAVPRK